MKKTPFLAAMILSQSAVSLPVMATESEPSSLTADFAERDLMPQTVAPASSWYTNNRFGSWGPKAATYPAPNVPPGVDANQWRRARVIAVAKKYIGLPYQHHPRARLDTS